MGFPQYLPVASSQESLYLCMGQMEEFGGFVGLNPLYQPHGKRGGGWPNVGPAGHLHPDTPSPAVHARQLLGSIPSGKLMHFLSGEEVLQCQGVYDNNCSLSRALTGL